MERFDDLTDAEILTLTDAQIAFYMDYECAKEGAPLMPPDYGPAPEVVEPKQDVTLYSVGGIYFQSMQDAEAVAAMANAAKRMTTEYARGGSYADRTCKPDDSPVEVSSTRFYSQKGWDENRVAVQQYNTAKSTWEIARKEYNEAAERRSRVTEWITNKIDRAREEDRQRKRYAAELERYTEIAQGNAVMAREFLLKARPEAAEFLPPMETVEA